MSASLIDKVRPGAAARNGRVEPGIHTVNARCAIGYEDDFAIFSPARVKVQHGSVGIYASGIHVSGSEAPCGIAML